MRGRWADADEDAAEDVSLGVLFCRPDAPTEYYEDIFDLEARIAEDLGFEVRFIDIDLVAQDQCEEALEDLPRGRGRCWVLRSWMLSAEEYAALHDAIRSRGDRLAVPPAAMELTTYLPEYLPLLRGQTPESRWTWGESIHDAWVRAQELGPPPWIVKDHVKSAKQRWDEACFVPEGAELEAFRAVCEGLLEFRGDRFERGFVIRRFVELARVYHPEPGMVCHDEWRLLFWQGKLVAWAPYHDTAHGTEPDLRWARRLAREIDSPFFAMDVARLHDADADAPARWIVVELNDGGMVGLPDTLDPSVLYEAILDDPP